MLFRQGCTMQMYLYADNWTAATEAVLQAGKERLSDSYLLVSEHYQSHKLYKNSPYC